MKRLLSVLLVLALVGCAAPVEGEAWYCFTDSTGALVTLPEAPETVAVLFSSHGEVWTLAGGEIAVTVGETLERGFAESAVLVDSGAGKTIDVEALLAAKPDFVIGSADIPAQVEACEAMRSVGIPAALFRVDTFDDYLAMLRICTDITGDEAAYQRHGAAVQTQIRALLAETEGRPSKTILFIRAGSRASATKAKTAPENFVCTMLQQLGAYNIADDATVLLDGLSLEHILVRQPEYIFVSTMGDEAAAKSYVTDLFAEEGWRQLTAVETGSWAFLPRELFHFKPNARWAEAYRYLAELLYEE